MGKLLLLLLFLFLFCFISFFLIFFFFHSREKTKLKSAETLTSCVEFFVRLLDWKENLSEEWGREALNLAMSTDSVHLLSRSLQVYRALQPRVDANSLNHLLSRFVIIYNFCFCDFFLLVLILIECFLLIRYKQYLVKKENVEVGLEIVCTLEEVRFFHHSHYLLSPL